MIDVINHDKISSRSIIESGPYEWVVAKLRIVGAHNEIYTLNIFKQWKTHCASEK